MRWTSNHVKEWLEWSILEHSLHDVIDVTKFQDVNGRDLCQMSRDDFVKLVGQFEVADKLMEHILYLRNGRARLKF